MGERVGMALTKRMLTLALLTISALVLIGYLIAWPTWEWIELQRTPPESGLMVLEPMSAQEAVRLKLVGGIIAGFFFAIGSTVGSFLNVVIYRMPRGESPTLKRSRCPHCGHPVRATDNLPVIGWLRLGGRCRDCRAEISPRYPLVELTFGLAFLVLYFVELISGGANLPVRTPNLYSGVVWVVLYTKWDLIAHYAFHLFAGSAGFVWSMIQSDRQAIPRRSLLTVGVLVVAAIMAFPWLLPMPSGLPWKLGVYGDALLTLGMGAGVGLMLGAVDRVLRRRWRGAEDPETLVPLLTLIGAVLGWQAVCVVAILGGALRLQVALFSGGWGVRRRYDSWLFLGVAAVHLLFWRDLLERAGSWWPSSVTSPGWSLVFGVGFAGLGIATAIIRQHHASHSGVEEERSACQENSEVANPELPAGAAELLPESSTCDSNHQEAVSPIATGDGSEKVSDEPNAVADSLSQDSPRSVL